MEEQETRFGAGRIRIDWRAREVWVDGRQEGVGDRALDLLAALLARRGEVLAKPELMASAWPGLVVADGNLHVQVNALRRLLGAEAIVNVRGRGYALVLQPDPPPGQVLFGREQDLAAVVAQLERQDARWLTLHGPGGVGKTRLAAAALQAVAHRFDLVRRIDLAPLRDAERLPDTLLHAFGLQPLGAASPTELLAEHLHQRSCLLLLDNLEQLRSGAPWLQALLDAAPTLKLLATSRVLLQQPHEAAFAVLPLAGPAADEPAASALRRAAMQLFVQRAAEAGQDLTRDEAELAAAIELCARLDGLPLALELAAARLKVLSARALREQVARLPQWLGAGADAPEHRQRSFADSLQWSLELLQPGTAQTLAQLALCEGGFDAEAAAVLGGAPGLAATLDRLGELIDHHLLQRRDDAAGRARYSMLEPVRDCARERLERSGLSAGVADAHAAHYAALAALGDRELRSGRRLAMLARLESERGNLRAALHHLLHVRRDAARALALAADSAWWWYFSGTLVEGRQWLAAALALPLADDPAHRSIRARALTGEAKMALYLGDFAGAAERAAQAVALAREAGADEVLAYALYHLAIPTQVRSQAAGLALYDEALALFTQRADDWGIALATIYGGIPLSFMPEQAAAARERLLDGQRRFQALGDAWGAAVADHYLGLMALRRGELEAATLHMRAVHEVSLALNDGFRIANGHHQAGRIALAAGRHAEADAEFLRAIETHMAQGRYGYATQLLNHAARQAMRAGDERRAARLIGAASVDRGPIIVPMFLPDELAGFTAAREQLRTKLGAAAFDKLVAEGRALTLAQGLALARERG